MIDSDGHFWQWIVRDLRIGGKYILKKSKKWFKKAPRKKSTNSLKFGSNTKTANKLANQMKKRGWTQASVKKLTNNPYTTRKSTNKATGNSATAYYAIEPKR